jgi:HlyD family secretion protein
MRSHPVRYLILFTLLAAAIAGVWYATQPKPVEVRLTAAEPGPVESIVANTRAGTVKACRRARLAPSVGGQIATLDVKEGQRVEKGTLLLALWNEDLTARVTLAEREAESAHSKTQAACLKAAHAGREAVRLKKLRQRGMASEGSVDEADTQANALQADCEAARASALVQEARIGVARANLAKTRLTAPFPGVVAEVNGELHEYVTPSPPGIPTPPAVDLIDDSCFYVTAPIDEVDAPEVALDQPTRISLDAFGERRFEARVRRVAPYVLDLEKQARTVEVEVEFSDGAGKGELLAGYSADVEIVTERRDGVLRIPTEALMENDRVYLYDAAAGELRQREIETGLSNWDWTEVRSGLQAGDRVVVSLAQEGLEDGVAAVPEEETEKQ